MYLIPKNIKTKSEIFSGFGIIEIIIIGLSLGIGYLFQLLSSNFYLKVFLFISLPLITFLLLLPLPNGGNTFIFLKKWYRYNTNQKIYKFK